MCTYNGSRYLEAQLASITAQDYQNWTVLVSDDGSTDDTLAILDGWCVTSAPSRLSVV